MKTARKVCDVRRSALGRSSLSIGKETIVSSGGKHELYLPPPKVEKLIFRIIPEMGARVAELQAGGVDIIGAVPPFMAPQLQGKRDTDIASVLGLRACT